MRGVRSSIVVSCGSLLAVAVAALFALRSAAGTPDPPVAANSIWQGIVEQSRPKSSYPAVLFIKELDGDSLKGTMWYPSLGNGLVKLSGRISAEGTVTLYEEEVLFAQPYRDGKLHVVEGTKYTAVLDGSVMKGTGELREFTDPNSKEKVTLKQAVTLKLSLTRVK